MKKKIVYIGLSADMLHHGHINLIKHAQKYGSLLIGLITDKVFSERKRLPLLNFQERKTILENIKGVDKVIAQNSWDYTINLKKYRPEFMLHGDDWLKGKELNLRKKVKKTLESYGGKLIEVPYTKGISSQALADQRYSLGITPEIRLKSLRR